MTKRNDVSSGTLYHRQLGIFNPDDYRDVEISIIGVGAIGSYVALNLAKIGFRDITVWDDDIVETLNHPGQIYSLEDVGALKVKALERHIHDLADISIKTEPKLWDGQLLRGVVISAVDTMSTRRALWDVHRHPRSTILFIDARIGGQDAFIFSATPLDVDSRDHYEASLYTDEAADDLPCTQRSVSDINLVVAGFITRSIRTFLRHGISSLVYEMYYNAQYMTLRKKTKEQFQVIS